MPLRAPRRVFDLGCGPGNSTEVLRQRYPNAEIVGIDSSPDMLAKARERLPGVSFVKADLRTWSPPADADLFYSNATFQWIPDHIPVLQRLLQALPEGGALAVQMPDNITEPSHRAIRETAASGPWAAALAHAARGQLPPVSVYYDALKPHCRRLDVWHTHYYHPLDGAPAIVEWVKATGLRPFIDPLPPDQRAAFLADYTQRIAAAYPPQCDGRSLLRFPRLFMVAVR